MSNRSAIYLDYAATTPVDAEVIAAALPYFGATFFNPASSHIFGQVASGALEYARRDCEKSINAARGTVYFTSGGTESINWAMKCAVLPDDGKVVVSAIEHDAVSACADRLAASGREVVRVKPNENGIITPDALEKAIGDKAAMVVVMTVNNIVGTIQPIKELSRIAHSRGALFFTDAVQAVNSVDIDVEDSGVDMLCVSGHKFYAPKNIGFLYVRDRRFITPFMDGGRQENGLRAGTADVAGAIALASAIKRAQGNIESYNAHALSVRNAFIETLRFGEPLCECVPHVNDIVSVVFDGIDAGRLAVALSVGGVCCSVGSACSAGAATPPETLTAMGMRNAGSAVRFSFGKPTTEEQAKNAAMTVNETVQKLLEVGSRAHE